MWFNLILKVTFGLKSNLRYRGYIIINSEVHSFQNRKECVNVVPCENCDPFKHI